MIGYLVIAHLFAGQTAFDQQSWADLLRVDQSGKLLCWQPMLNTPFGASLTPKQMAAERSSLVAEMKSCCHLDRGELTVYGDGSGIETNLVVRKYILEFQWRVPSGGEAVVYLRGNPAIRLRDSRSRIDSDLGLGAGGLFLNQQYRAHPLIFADKQVMEWNDMRIMHKDDRVTVVLNGIKVVDSVPLEPFWQRTQAISIEGSLGVGSVRGSIQFRSMRLMKLPND